MLALVFPRQAVPVLKDHSFAADGVTNLFDGYHSKIM